MDLRVLIFFIFNTKTKPNFTQTVTYDLLTSTWRDVIMYIGYYRLQGKPKTLLSVIWVSFKYFLYLLPLSFISEV